MMTVFFLPPAKPAAEARARRMSGRLNPARTRAGCPPEGGTPGSARESEDRLRGTASGSYPTQLTLEAGFFHLRLVGSSRCSADNSRSRRAVSYSGFHLDFGLARHG